ncbi:MAG: RNA polymerase subunit sigma [Planctomycetes bacterium]|nr:RNA polymerase subunit sigma [Planctomycetota bacterium]
MVGINKPSDHAPRVIWKIIGKEQDLDVPDDKPVATLLAQIGDGNTHAAETILPLVYDDLRTLAHGYLAKEPAELSLQTTGLVHEAYIRLVGDVDVPWANRAHFFAAAATAMRRILVEEARRRATEKHGGGRKRVDLESVPPDSNPLAENILALDEALKRLEVEDKRASHIIMLRHFAGLTIAETASALDISPRTVTLDWRCARAWLCREIRKGDTTIGGKTSGTAA